MDFDFERKCLFGMYQVLQVHLLWLLWLSASLNVATGRQGHFVWLVFDTDQRFFDFKINFFL